jgi:hypothetical protein
MQWLSPVDSWESHEAATKAHQSGTSNWLIECKDFEDWYSADRSFLLLTGLREYILLCIVSIAKCLSYSRSGKIYSFVN